MTDVSAKKNLRTGECAVMAAACRRPDVFEIWLLLMAAQARFVPAATAESECRAFDGFG
ncbi:MAG: hypothetical protein LBU13_03020 [Synergistaceae bacterium]|nr:hypothetical protein [Synergistaceae bacterium]